MSRLSDIPVRMETSTVAPASRRANPGGLGGMGGGTGAVLSELATLLERLSGHDETAMIDLRSLPLNEEDRAALRTALGTGEVRATLTADGVSTAQETQFSGVWWLEHRDAGGDITAELLEVARFPQILASATDEIAAAGLALRTHGQPS
jgi:hydrogenase-1 operon protein HyaF